MKMGSRSGTFGSRSDFLPSDMRFKALSNKRWLLLLLSKNACRYQITAVS